MQCMLTQLLLQIYTKLETVNDLTLQICGDDATPWPTIRVQGRLAQGPDCRTRNQCSARHSVSVTQQTQQTRRHHRPTQVSSLIILVCSILVISSFGARCSRLLPKWPKHCSEEEEKQIAMSTWSAPIPIDGGFRSLICSEQFIFIREYIWFRRTRISKDAMTASHCLMKHVVCIYQHLCVCTELDERPVMLVRTVKQHQQKLVLLWGFP